MAQTNEELAQELIRDGYLKSPLLIEAFGKIDRKDFVPCELWGEAYGNYPLPIGDGQTISQPLTVAFMLELLAPQPGEKVLDVGSGSGWTTALLAQAVSSVKGHGSRVGNVVAVERIPELCKMGEKNAQKYSFTEKGVVKFFCGDATNGVPVRFLPAKGFSKILAGASAEKEIPRAWKEQLKTGGRIVAPVGASIIVLDKISENEFRKREHFGFSFVPLVAGK